MYTIILFSSFIITISSIILLSLRPLNIGIIILGISLILTLIYSQILTSWIAFLIFLIYIGGILVIFTYFVALTPNQQTNVSLIPIVLIFFSSLLVITINKPIPISMTNRKFIYTFYLTRNIQLLVILALILLFTIVVVVKLVIINKGPLRPFIK